MKQKYTGGGQMGSIGSINCNSSKLNSSGSRTHMPAMSGTANPGGHIKREPSAEQGNVPLPGVPKG